MKFIYNFYKESLQILKPKMKKFLKILLKLDEYLILI